MAEGVGYEIKDTLNKALALTRIIGRLAELEPDYQKESDMGLVGEIATALIQEAYNKIDNLQRG